MTPIKITKYGWEVLILFLVSIIPIVTYIHLPFHTIVILYLVGMTFEILTEDSWNYNKAMDRATFMLRDRDVSLIFGLGWIGTLSFGMSFAKVLRDFADVDLYWSLFIALGVVGNILEASFLKLGLWKYNMEAKGVNLGFKHMPCILGVPLSVVVGYFVFQGTLMYYVVFKLVPWMFNCPQPL
ncbi:MAG: hypothetical protein OCD01_09140 [Fibrobacterales bacterium]